jgi:predicted Ser/Thr protein kinase
MAPAVLWGDFEVRFDRVLGRGGMGTVYLARQVSLGRDVALKVLDPARADEALRSGLFDRFRIEIQSLAKLNHPGIVSIYQAGENDGRLWFAMERVDGRTLDQRLSIEGALPEAEARRIAADVARALDAALRAGIIHRDVKPANVFLRNDGSVKIGDFGLARSPEFARTPITESNALACTPAYASPEQVEGGDCDHRGDIYSLGAVLYEMVTERPPFPAATALAALHRAATSEPTGVRLLNPGISPELERIIGRCLEKDPAKRYPTYGALIADLEPKAGSPRRDWVLPAAASAGLALLGAILAAVFMTDPAAPPPAAPEPILVQVPIPAPEPPPPPPPPKPEPPTEPEPAPTAALERPSKRELEAAERLLALSRESFDARTAWDFDRALARLAAFVKKEEPTPWVKGLADAEEARLRSAAAVPEFRAGQAVTLVLRTGRVVAGTLVSADRRELALELAGGLRETFPRAAVAPATFGPDALLLRAGAVDARGVLGRLAELDERHAPGVVDQAIEEALRGDLADLAGFRVPDGLRERLDPLLAARFRLLDEEAEAARLHMGGDFAKLLLERPLTRAGGRASARFHEEFRASLPEDPDLELVGEVPWGTWDVEGAARFDAAAKSYVLPPGAWIRKPFRGAQRGYEVRFRLGEGARLAVALSFTRWLEVSAREYRLLAAAKGEEPRQVARLDLDRRPAEGVLAVVPRAPLALVYLDGRLLAALPEADFALGDGMQLGAAAGTLTLVGIRVIDRTR